MLIVLPPRAEPGPAGGAGLGRVGLAGDDDLADLVLGGQVVDDRGQIAVGEPAGDRRQAERRVDPVRADHGGQLDRAGHLRADPLRAGGGGLGQPPLRAVTDSQERGLGFGPRPRPRLARPVPARVVRVVLVADGRAARHRQTVPGDLGRAPAGAGGDHQFLPGSPAPHPRAGVAGRGGVADRPEPRPNAPTTGRTRRPARVTSRPPGRGRARTRSAGGLVRALRRSPRTARARRGGHSPPPRCIDEDGALENIRTRDLEVA